MRIRCTIVLLVAALCSLQSNAQENDAKVLYFGGAESCAAWLNSSTDPALADYRRNWIYGFFSGANILGKTPLVGHSTDQEGIVGEVIKLCKDEPSIQLAVATARVYQKLQKEGR